MSLIPYKNTGDSFSANEVNLISSTITGNTEKILILSANTIGIQSALTSDYYTKSQSDDKYSTGYTLTKSGITSALGYTPLSASTVDLSNYQIKGNYVSANTLTQYYTTGNTYSKLESDAKYLTGYTLVSSAITNSLGYVPLSSSTYTLVSSAITSALGFTPISASTFVPTTDASLLTGGTIPDARLSGIWATKADVQAISQGSVADSAITTNKLASKAVTIDKTSYITPTVNKNKFNPSATDFVSSGYTDPTNGVTGTAGSNTTYDSSGYIAIGAGVNYVVNKLTRSICYYNSSKVFISSIQNVAANSYKTTPANTAYIRFAAVKANIAGYQLELGTLSTTYENYLLTNEMDAYVLAGGLTTSGITQLKSKAVFSTSNVDFLETIGKKNLFNINNTDNIIGSYVDNATGTIFTNSIYNLTHYIPVKAGLSYVVNFKQRCAFYDVNKNFVSGDNTAANAVTGIALIAPVDGFIRCTVAVAYWDRFQIEQSTMLSNWDAYNEVASYKGYLPQERIIGDNEIQLFLPPEICVAVGRTIELYNKQVTWAGNFEDFHYSWSGAGKSLKRKWSFTGTSGLIGTYTLTLNVYNNAFKLVATATTTVKCVSATITTPTSLVTIGDSLSNGKPWFDELKVLAPSGFTFIGTHYGNNGDRNDGRSGVAANWYLADSVYGFVDANSGVTGNDGRLPNKNPLWNPTGYNVTTSAFTGAVDWAYYKSNYNLNPTKVMIWLGTNGISIDTRLNVTSIKAIVDAIRANDANIKIFIVNTLFRADQNGIGIQQSNDGYTASQDWKKNEDRKVFNLQVDLTNALKNYSNLFFIPVAACHDSEFNFGSVATPVNPRAAQTENYPVESVHPQLQGYLQMADIMFSSFAAHQ